MDSIRAIGRGTGPWTWDDLASYKAKQQRCRWCGAMRCDAMGNGGWWELKLQTAVGIYSRLAISSRRTGRAVTGGWVFLSVPG
jgi:hypothetical protein